MIKCKLCGNHSASEILKVCVHCIREGSEKAVDLIRSAYEKSRRLLNLPLYPPKHKNGISCNLCMNECKMDDGEWGFCGIRRNVDGRVEGPTKSQAILHEYYDRNPTNCCAAWFCPAQTGCGYPKYTKSKNGEFGTFNHSIFFYGCSFNCLYCQNASHKTQRHLVDYTSIDKVIKKSNRPDVTCICYFGGSPEPHFPFALNLSRKLVDSSNIKRICWEWNGSGNEILVKEATKLSLQSGGIVKFDLKAFNPLIAKALLGVSLDRTFKNFESVASFFDSRPEIPIVTATTLLVPYYVDEVEVEFIAQFISKINPDIPYSMLVFHPQFYLSDLPFTPIEQVKRCYQIAKKYLKNVNVGNKHLIENAPLD